ncbi:Bromodomain-containing protein 9 [Linnemannia exigua]|uniref:Bromodomain-containing protein 9 n=1 Tax=Linnemannia exigua TaxID=604196 RepID=A0AAD4H4C8_9FUNG|nr:Bromodomain-containing protein 9 [Linnemannia exigua]
MGAARSPPPPDLDPPHSSDSFYTRPPSTKRKSSSSRTPAEEDYHLYNNHHDTSSSSRDRKKKKKSKKERRDYYDYDENNNDQRFNDYDQDESTSPPPPPRPVIKLPPLKISLKLSSIAPPSSSLASSSHKSGNASKKKRRSSEQISIVSDDENDEYNNDEQEAGHSYHRRQSSVGLDEDQDMDTPQPSSHKKKKKHKHKHRHRHPRHEEQEVEEPQQHQQHPYYEEEPEEQDEIEEEDASGQDTRITLRLGKEKKKKSRRSSTHRSHPSHPSDETEQHHRRPTLPPPTQSKARSRSRSISQSQSTDVSISIKQEEPPVQPTPTYHDPTPTHPHPYSQVGMKKPRSALLNMENQETAVPQDEDADLDDPLAGELDEPEDDEEDDDDEEEEEEGDESDNDSLMSPILDPGTNAQFGSKTVRAGQVGSKTLPPSASTSKPKKQRKPSVAIELKDSNESTPREGRDSYVLFSQPVDPTMVPDYATIIKNPMDLSTMRSKVDRNFYPTIDEFLMDFQLVCDNARLYNAKETLYWRQADKLWDWGSRAIERERKTILDRDEEVMRTVKDEETLDIGGMGDYSGGGSSNANGLQGRGTFMSVESAVDSPMSIADSGRSHTPQQYRKAKKIKHRRDGTIAFSYATDGSIDPASHPDPWSLVPVDTDFGSPPTLHPLLEVNTQYSGQYLDDYPYWKARTAGSRPAAYLDYGPYAILDKSPAETDGSSSVSLPVFTGMVFGDDTGEAYVRSLAMFMEGIVDDKELSHMTESDAAGLLQVKEHIRKKVEKLTQGASTIADKVAAIVLEEKTGQPSDVDTRVPMSLWQQDFDTEMKDAGRPMAATLLGKVGEKKVVARDDSQDMLIDPPTEPKDAAMEDAIAPSEGVEVDGTVGAADAVEAKDAQVKSEKEDLHSPSSDAEPEMIDIRQIVRDIKAWPQAQKVKADYESWRQLKIELDSLLPVAPAEDDVKIQWGESWKGGDLEESKKWVREYLEQNSADMRKVVELMAVKTAEDQTAKTAAEVTAESTPTDAKGTPKEASSTKEKDAEKVTLSEEDKALVQRLAKNIRKRLAEMVKYVPLSEVNPQKLPPPVAPTPAPAAATPAATSATATTPAVATPAVATPLTATAPVATTSTSTPTVPSAAATPAATATTATFPTAPAGATPTTLASTTATSVSTSVPAAGSVTTRPSSAHPMQTVPAAPVAAPVAVPVVAATSAPPALVPAPTVPVSTTPTPAFTQAAELLTPEPTPVTPLSSSTAVATSPTSQSSTTLFAPIIEAVVSKPHSEPVAETEIMPDPVANTPPVAVPAASPEREGSTSSLSSPGSSP